VSGNARADAGEVNVIYGSATGLSTTAHAPQVLRNLSTPQAGDHFGASLSAWNFGRNEFVIFDGHTIVLTATDLAVGIPYQDVNGISNAGAVNVFYGSRSVNGLSTANSAILTADNLNIGGLAGAHFGAAIY
jgi:hypothetical protein